MNISDETMLWLSCYFLSVERKSANDLYWTIVNFGWVPRLSS